MLPALQRAIGLQKQVKNLSLHSHPARKKYPVVCKWDDLARMQKWQIRRRATIIWIAASVLPFVFDPFCFWLPRAGSLNVACLRNKQTGGYSLEDLNKPTSLSGVATAKQPHSTESAYKIVRYPIDAKIKTKEATVGSNPSFRCSRHQLKGHFESYR